MPTPQVILTALDVVTPQVMGDTLSVDTTVLPYVVLADLNTSQIELSIYNTTYVNQTPTVVGAQNRFSGSISIDPLNPSTSVSIIGRNYDPTVVWLPNHVFVAGTRLVDGNGNVQLCTQGGITGGTEPTWNATVGGNTNDPSPAVSTGVIWQNKGVLAITPIFKFGLLYYATSDALVIAPPSAVKAYKGLTSCRLEWQQPTYTGFIGVRVMISTDESGVNTPYTQFGDLVNNITRTDNVVIAEETATQVNGNQTVITTAQTTETVNYSSVDIPLAQVNQQKFYALLSTVIQDPNTQAIFESQQNGPITCGYVNLRLTSPTDFLALQRKEDVAGRLISSITKVYPDLDLTPRSEARDIMIDPFSLELSNMSVREWFSRVSQSISALSQIDDANGDGISDPYNQSPFKQQIARAYGLSAQDTQSLIDKQFDILGEQAGLRRGGARFSVVDVTFYTYTKPSASTTFGEGIQLTTSPDANTPALTFQTRGAATVTPQTASSFYDPSKGWWAVTVPAECLTAGSAGNVGAGTIRTIASGGPANWNVVNLDSADFGVNTQSNASFAAQIADKLVMGVDSGTRNGYLVAARETPGVVNAIVVAAGDLEMLRDWDPVRLKHVFGKVDIYVRGTDTSVQNETSLFAYADTGTYGLLDSYLTLSLLDNNLLKFQVNNFSTLSYPLYTVVEFAATRSGSTFYFGIQNAQIDNTNGYIILDPNELCYQYTNTGDITKAKMPFLINGNPATNKLALNSIVSGGLGTTVFNVYARYQSPLSIVPTLQPVLTVNSVTGSGATGLISPEYVRLIHTSNFYLDGLSQNAGDTVAVNSTTYVPTTKTITSSTAAPVLIDSGMNVPVNSNGVPQNVLSVRSADLSTLYTYGTDYTIVADGPYHQYALKSLVTQVNVLSVGITSNILTVQGNNSVLPGTQVTFSGLATATFLNGVTVTVATATSTGFTAVYTYAGTYGPTADQGIASYSNIANGSSVVVGYNKYVLSEQLAYAANEAQTLVGTIPSQLDNAGFVKNVWLPESYGNTILSYDGAVFNPDGTINFASSTGLVGAQVPHASRYIKVTFNDGVSDLVKREGIDYTLTVDPTSGAATIARILTGTIPNNGVVKVSYFYTESFAISTDYPSFVQILTNSINSSKHAAADVSVKAMVENHVDVTMTVELDANAAPETVDPNIRTAVSITMDNAVGKLTQSEMVRQVKAVTGITNVELPLIKFAKSDGAYDIGVIITEGTTWVPLASDPKFATQQLPPNAFITSAAALPDNTIPSGGLPDSFVGLLYQGQAYRRASSVQDFLHNTGTTPSFYIIGLNDQIDSSNPLTGYELKILLTEPQVVNPGNRSYFVTYQVFNEGGAKDIDMSSTEYLVPGNVTINYITSGS